MGAMVPLDEQRVPGGTGRPGPVVARGMLAGRRGEAPSVHQSFCLGRGTLEESGQPGWPGGRGMSLPACPRVASRDWSVRRC